MVSFTGQAVNVASLSAGTPESVMQSEVTLPIQVVGCAVYTPAKKTTYPTYNITANVTGNFSSNMTDKHVLNVLLSHQRLQQQQEKQLPSGGPVGVNCVSPIHFWKNCIHREPDQQNGRCAAVTKLPAGPTTPFFPQPGAKTNRHYKGVMSKTTNTGNKPVDLWFKAAQALIATQFNELSGVVLPQPVMDAVSLIGSVVGTTSSTPPTLDMSLPGLAPAINVLEMFNSGQVNSAWLCLLVGMDPSLEAVCFDSGCWLPVECVCLLVSTCPATTYTAHTDSCVLCSVAVLSCLQAGVEPC